MKVLFVASEVAPFSKSGGLADVCAALPAALAARGHELVVVTPLYAEVPRQGVRDLSGPHRLRFPFGEISFGIKEATPAGGPRVLLLAQDELFGRAELYGHADDHRRFAFLGVGALAAAQRLGLGPDVIHLHDWQTSLAAVALAHGFRGTALAGARTVLTIHNLAYQGWFPPEAMDELGLPWALFHPEGLEFYGKLNFLKAGLLFADALTTVSPRYAQEILTREGGHGLDGVLRRRAADLHGILNGVDYAEWNTEHNPHLPKAYSARDLSGKRLCRREVLRRLGLPWPAGSPRAPLFGMVGRLAEQKGIELLLAVLPRLLERNVPVVMLCAGDPAYAAALRALKQRFPGRLGLRLGYDHDLAHLIEAGSDFFLMPSLFEPCGLNQLYSLRYGTVPIVRAVGGLDDTVVDLSLPEGTGIKFDEFSASALWRAIERAFRLWSDREALAAVQKRGMACDFSWDRSASRYEALYRSLRRA